MTTIPEMADYAVCPNCDVVLDNLTLALRHRDERIAELEEDRANLEKDLRGKRSQNKRLRADQDAMLRNDDRYEDAQAVLEHWKAVCAPKARELGGKRLENVLARLNGTYTVNELMRSADGYAMKPYMTRNGRQHQGAKDEWRADAELIYRDAGKVDAGLHIAERADDLRQVLAARKPAQPIVSDPAAKLIGLSPLGEAALRLAGFGWMVFPCRAREKAPATPNGLLDAKRDPEAIRACWAAHPHLNIGVRCGSASGIVVLDVDGDEGWETLHRLEDEHGDLPTTASVTTPRGGQHFYFLHPGVEIRNTAGFPGPSLDIRGDGGYVLAPPSVGPGGRQYEVDEQSAIKPMPDWLLDLLKGHQSRVDQVLSGGFDLAALVETGATPGERNSRMTQGVGKLYHYGMTAAEVYAFARVVNSQLKPPLPEKELASIVKSIAKRRNT